MLTGILQSVTDRRPDPLLRAFLRARDEATARQALDRLHNEHVRPLLQTIISRKCGVAFDRDGNVRQETSGLDVQDVLNDARLAVTERLLGLRQGDGAETIADLRAYVAMTAYRASSTHLRCKKPLWSQLKAALRFLLTHQPGFAEWPTRQGPSAAGFAQWRDRQNDRLTSPRLESLRRDPAGSLKDALPLDRLGSKPTADVLEAVFNHLGHPLETDDLVNICAALYQIKDQEALAGTDSEGEDVLERVASRGQAPSDVVEQKEQLRRLWEELRTAKLTHRQALLLNLRDGAGKGVIAFLPILGVASLREIADSLEMSVEELAEIWDELPWEDLQIAERLGLTRQQVIDCRKNCRHRLERRAVGSEK